MCNLYRLGSASADVARLFGTAMPAASNAGPEVYPGYPGLVFDGDALRSMVWGFPLALKGKSGQPLKPKPVNNTRTDKLGSGFWKASFTSRRCLIPLTAFAEAEGPKGGKTRTWFSLPGQPVFTAAGIWRDSAEWGPVYSMVMTDAAPAVEGIHDRSPVLLDPEKRTTWLQADADEALSLCRPYDGKMSVERTEESWVRRKN